MSKHEPNVRYMPMMRAAIDDAKNLLIDKRLHGVIVMTIRPDDDSTGPDQGHISSVRALGYLPEGVPAVLRRTATRIELDSGTAPWWRRVVESIRSLFVGYLHD